MEEIYTANNLVALDACAPFNSFIIKSHYKFGLSEDTKDLINKRNATRKAMSAANQ